MATPTTCVARAEDRIEYAFRALQSGRRVYDVRRLLKKRYNVGYRSVYKYIRAAQNKIIEESGKPIEEWRTRALGVYESIIASGKSSNAERIKATDGIVSLLGLKIVRIEHSGDVKVDISGKDTPLPTKEEVHQMLQTILSKIKKPSDKPAK